MTTDQELKPQRRREPPAGLPPKNGAPPSANGHGTPPEHRQRSGPGWRAHAKAWFIEKYCVHFPALQPDEIGQLEGVRQEAALLNARWNHLEQRQAIITEEVVTAEQHKYTEDRNLHRGLLSGNGLLIAALAILCVANGAYLVHQFQETKSWLAAILMVAPLGPAGLALDCLIHGRLSRLENWLNAGVLAVFVVALGLFGFSLSGQVREAALVAEASSAALREGSSRTIQLLSQLALEVAMATIFFGEVRRLHALLPSRRWQRRQADLAAILQEMEALLQRRSAVSATLRVLEERDRQSQELQDDFRNHP